MSKQVAISVMLTIIWAGLLGACSSGVSFKSQPEGDRPEVTGTSSPLETVKPSPTTSEAVQRDPSHPAEIVPQDIPKRHIFLTSLEASKAVSAKDIESFMVTLIHNGNSDTEVNVSLETTQGTTWKSALCFDDLCYIHNGKDKLLQTLSVAAGEERQLEIKMFVPKTANSGEAKTLKLEAAAVENLAAPASLELEGFIP